MSLLDHLKSQPKKLIVLGVLLCASLAWNLRDIFIWARQGAAIEGININQQQTISVIEQYLNSISTPFTASVKDLAAQTGSPSWGCGPTSYAMMEIINHRFFNDGLSVSANYDNNPYEIVERFGLARTANGSVIDHGWVEIYMKDKIMFIDPTIEQFGRFKGIVYEVFSIGDPNITETLYSKYGIIDYRLSLLVQKTINRRPASADPYPGTIINPEDIPYYQKVIQDRDVVNSGEVPEDWKSWVSALTDKFE